MSEFTFTLRPERKPVTSTTTFVRDLTPGTFVRGILTHVRTRPNVWFVFQDPSSYEMRAVSLDETTPTVLTESNFLTTNTLEVLEVQR